MIKFNPFNEEATRMRIAEQIKGLVEEIMDPATFEEERYELNEAYKKLDRTYKYLGGVYTEYLSSTGWKRF